MRSLRSPNSPCVFRVREIFQIRKRRTKKEKKHLFLSFSCRSYLACNTFRQILAVRLSGYFLKISKHCSGGGGEASMSLKT